MSNDIYLQLGIDSNKLKRDYIKYPLKLFKGNKKPDKPYKEDLEYLYIELNVSLQDLMNYFNVSKGSIRRWLKYYNIKKDRHLSVIHRVKTNLEKYGVSNISQTKEIKEKKKQSWIKKYGVENPTQSKEVQEKTKQTNLEKYGVEYVTQTKEYKENIDIIQEKIYNTKKKNHTFNTSKLEEQIYELLKLKFKEVKRQYKEVRYPFACDFYISEKDLFIEIQGNFTHGNEPYTGTKKQKETIKLWESKNTEYYNNAINVWTIRDPLKRKTVKENNLNYLEFFNIEQFMAWYNKQ